MRNPTIVIVTFERLMSTKRCIETLLQNTPQPLNLVLVDNCSSNSLRRFLARQPGTKLFLDSNVGLYRALNLGINLAREELVAFLDCDIVVTPGWWEALSKEVETDQSVGLAGSRYLNPDGSLQEGYPVLSENGWYGSNLEDRNSASDCQYIAIGCSVFRRSAWQAVGGFDEGYFISHGDIDFCYKLRYEAGFRIRYCPESSVVHDHDYLKEEKYESIRFNSEICSKDFKRFQSKWESFYRIESYARQGENDWS